MSKMREAFEVMYQRHWEDTEREITEAFESGYQAAIAAVKEGGAVAYVRKWAFDGEEPHKEKRDNGRMAWPMKYKLLPVTQTKCLDDDIVAYPLPEDV